MMPMQQPVEQNDPLPHVELSVHVASPVGHTAMLQLAGRSLGSWPGHRMHEVPPHVEFPHDGTFVQVLHFVGSLIVVGPHSGEVVGLMMMLEHWLEAGSQTVQQPKQSQPG